jgi:hypothetical protein
VKAIGAQFLEPFNGLLRQPGDELATQFVSEEIELTIDQRNAAKSRALRLVSELTAILRTYDGSEKEWQVSDEDNKELEERLSELNKRVYAMLAHADTVNRLVEEDDILRLELTKPIQRNF